MKRLVRLLAILAGTLIVALVLALIFARLYFTDEKILATVRPQLTEKLTREIDIQSAEVSFWGGLGVRLEQVTLGNAPGFDRPVFLHLDELDIKVRFWPLLSGDVVFDRVLLGPGELRLEIDSIGNNWAGIVKPDTTAIPLTPVDSAIASLPKIPVLGKMEFAGITISFDDYRDGSSIELAAIEGALELTPQETELGARATGEFQIGGGSYKSKTINLDLAQAQPRIEFNLWMSLLDKSIDLETSTLTIFDIPVGFSGTVENLGDTARYAIDIKIEPTSLAPVFDFLPDSLWLPSFPDGPPQGEIQAEIKLSSPPPGVEYPYPEGKVLVSGLSGQYGEKKLPFDIAGLDIRLNKTVASLAAQSLTIAGIPLNANLTIDQFDNPNFSCGINGTVEVSQLAELMESSPDVETGGQIEIALSGFGAVKNWRGMSVNGNVQLSGFRWRVPDPTATAIDDLSGGLRFTGRGVNVERLSLRSGPSMLEINGQIHDLIPYLMLGGKDVGKPRFEFELHSPFVDLDRMFPASDTTVDEPPPLPLIDLVAEGTMFIDSAIYCAVPFGNLTGNIHYADWKLDISDIRGRAYGGTVTGKAEVDFTDFERPEFRIETKGKQIEADEFLTDFTGFGGHLFGKIDLTGSFAGRGAEVIDILRSLTANGTVSMTEGRFEGLSILSTLADQAAITRIKDSGPIKDMTADFWVDQGRLYCNDWNFSSDGTTYRLAGSVGFDGSLDYRVNIKLPKTKGGSGVLSQLGDLFGGGGIALDLSLTGTYTHPVIKLDTKNNRRRFEENLKDKAKDLLEQLRRK
jgi:hypothetical protein